MTPEEYRQMIPTTLYLSDEEFDELVEWLDEPDKPNEKLVALFKRPRVFTRDCE